ncbi:hypothetical protein [Geopseudomonas aromaticivorans]
MGLPKEQKTLLKIYKGASKLITHRSDISASNPPKLTDEGVVVGVNLTLDQNLLDGLPAERKITVNETTPGSTTPKVTYWWRLDGLFSDARGNPIDGWLCEQPGITTRHSPWEWEGFEIISEGACNADFLACHLDATDTLDESERTDYAARIDLADNGPVRSRLYDIIDGADGSIRDDKLTTKEIMSALAKPWLAQSIARLITHYESEWYADEGFSKWEALNCYMTKEGETDWPQEKERIKSLLWLPDLMSSGSSTLTESVWQFHPITAVTCFNSSCIPLVRAQEIALLVSSGYEGKAELDFEALAGNFDGQGMSFGVIQWNFGQGTLGPVLKEMRDADTSTFDACFGENMNLNTLISALNSGNQTTQFNWSTSVQSTNQAGWKQAFKNIGQVEKFKSIQLKNAAKYHENVLICINLMREIAPQHMTTIELRTYVALYDLCVQQNNLNKAKQDITEDYSPSDINNQNDLLIYVCKKRAERAASGWVSDCLSRRMGIIQGSTYTATANGLTSSRANPNFVKIIAGTVCEI